MRVYETKFRLTNPVNDIEAARLYLAEDDMTEYLWDYSSVNPDALKAIKKIEWILETEDSGKIILTSEKELDEKSLNEVSDWVRGQNSDGLGEGFEQQRFATEEIYDEYGDIDYDAEPIMSSFDWETNYYRFVEVI